MEATSGTEELKETGQEDTIEARLERQSRVG
jgi:hypothetical protein